jgi:hypothetical protein
VTRALLGRQFADKAITDPPPVVRTNGRTSQALPAGIGTPGRFAVILRSESPACEVGPPVTGRQEPGTSDGRSPKFPRAFLAARASRNHRGVGPARAYKTPKHQIFRRPRPPRASAAHIPPRTDFRGRRVSRQNRKLSQDKFFRVPGQRGRPVSDWSAPPGPRKFPAVGASSARFSLI